MRSVVVPFALLALACEDPLKLAQRLEEPRLLGVRVVSSNGAASLTPGESATVEFLLAGPDGPVDAALAFRVCEAARSDRGVPYCAAEAFAEAETGSLGAPTPFEVPASVPLGARLAILGVACVEGEPELRDAPLDWRCRGGGEALRSSFDAWTGGASSTQRNPDLSELVITLAGAPLALDDPRAVPTCDAGALEVTADTAHTLVMHLGDAAREPEDGSDAQPLESLQLSHFSTHGSFERQFSFIPPAAAPEMSLTWQAPGTGTAVKLYLVVRDGRGGVSWVSASVCAR